MAENTILQEKRDSIEVSRNAKGDYSWKAKIYYDSATESMEEVVNDLKRIDDMLQERFL
jgi:hypothetical protein